MKRFFAIVLLFSVFSVVASVEAKNKKETQVDHVALAALLIKDGLYDRAELVLHNVDTTKKGVDLARYHTLRGLIFLQRSLFVEARDAFRTAVGTGQKEPIVHLYSAQASFGLKDWKNTVAEIALAGATAEDIPATYVMLEQCYWHLGDKEKAWNALSRGEKRHPDYAECTRRKFFHLIEMGLYQNAVTEGKRFLDRTKGSEQDYLLVGAALRKSRQYDKALPFLESARLRFPESDAVTVELARTYLDAGNVLTAADLFEQSARRNPKFIADAAELFRRAKQYYRALHLNPLIPDQKEKFKQKLAIYLETERYELVAGMTTDLNRVGLLRNDDIRYALAYAFFQTGNFKKAQEQLVHIEKPELFRRAAELRREMERSADDPARGEY